MTRIEGGELPMTSPNNNILTVDVREDIRQGKEPCEKIMAAAARLEPGDTLLLINSFEPLPLYNAMEQKGFSHRTERTGDGNWKIYFRREGGRII